MDIGEKIVLHFLVAAYALILVTCSIRLFNQKSFSAKFSLFHSLHALLWLISFVRSIWLLLYAWGILEGEVGEIADFILSSIPGFMFFSLWSLLACFWAELYENYRQHGTFVELPFIWRTAYTLNGVMYALAAITYTLRILNTFNEKLLTIVFYTFGSLVCISCLVPYLIYGRNVLISLLSNEEFQSASLERRRRRLRSITAILGIGSVGLFVRSCFLLVIVHVENLYENDWAQLSFYFITDYLPLIMFLKILRKKPVTETTPLLYGTNQTPTLIGNSHRSRL